MPLIYKDAVLHDGVRCACCTVQMADVAKTIDPTGTRIIRMAMRAAMTIRFNRVRVMVREAIADANILGLNHGQVTSGMVAAQMSMGGSNRIEVFQRFIDSAMALTVLEQNGGYLKPYIERAYGKGTLFGYSQAGAAPNQDPMEHQRTQNKVDTLAKLSFVELQGVCEAVSQQACRAVAQGILSNTHPNKIVRAVYAVISKVGIDRVTTIAEFVIVKAFNEATLDAYEALGVAQVGLVPEARRQTRDENIQDAVRRRSGGGAGSRISRTESPSRRTVQRIRQQEVQVETLGAKVRVRTAGDDDVCPVCEAIAENGPYKINTARALIPAHPRCRCTFVPVRDRRFTADEIRTAQ